MKWFFAAAGKGNVAAALMVANMYYNGIGIEQNYPEAYKFAKFAADKGNIYSCAMLGDMYFYGKGVIKDYRQARQYYQDVLWHSSVCQWDRYGPDEKKIISEIQYKLAYMYYYGIGATKNPQKAVELATVSAQRGNINAKKFLDEIRNK